MIFATPVVIVLVASIVRADTTREIRSLDARMDKVAQTLAVIDGERHRLEERLEELQSEQVDIEKFISEEYANVVRSMVSIGYINELLDGVGAHNLVMAPELWSLEIMQKSLIRERSLRIAAMKQKLLRLRAIRKEIEQHITELKRSRKNYEALLQKLKILRAEKVKALELVKFEKNVVPSLLPDSDGLSVKSKPADFRGEAVLKDMKGRLELPVVGTVVIGSSEKKNTPLPILRYNRGVFIRAKPGELVRSVAAGRVVFARWFRDLGRMVIIDHGEHFFSVYALLGSFLKGEGDRVLKGEPIGKVGPPELASQPGIYFEWRKNGRSLAIKEWFLISKK